MTKKPETREEHQTRLRPVYELLKSHGHSVFLDLCELTLMCAAEIGGAIKWDHPRVIIDIKQRVAAEKRAKKRGVELDPEQMP